ncbi:MAG: molecular chaperone HtpG [Chloroflexi bacterium]|nr:molecular chaperone HtpG [Chloroflexota bacterium]
MTEQGTEKTRNFQFKAETRQLLDILINSLYSDRDVFLRELISNASDAITRLNFEMLTNNQVVDADVEPAIRIYPDKEAGTLKIVDTGIGMNDAELKDNLGTIAKSGARNFLDAAKDNPEATVNDLIGKFGVGFYAAFMVAESIEVKSRSFRPEDHGALWRSTGTGNFSLGASDKTARGSEILIKLKEDALEYTEEYRIREIVRKHSNYIPFPIYIGDGTERINAESTLWRQSPSEVKEEDYEQFYQNFTLDFDKPITKLHLSIDAPFQMYALLFVPQKAERTMFSLRKEDGLQLYARKVLIQDYCTDLLPRYYRFIEGVIDSEDIPLNVTRESMQANRVILTLRKILSGKVTDMLKKLGSDQPEEYTTFWKRYSPFISEGIVTDPDAKDALVPLLRYRTLNHGDDYRSLTEYVAEMKPGQDKIYYLIGEAIETTRNSPHLEMLKKDGKDVLLMVDPFDPFVVTSLGKFQDFDFVNAATEKSVSDLENQKPDAEKKEEKPETPSEYEGLIQSIRDVLGEDVTDVRTTDRLVESAARLVNAENSMSPEMRKMYNLMQQEVGTDKKVLEINPSHPLVQKLAELDDAETKNDVIRQIYDGARIMDGETLDQAQMLNRMQRLLLRLLK